MPNSEKRFGNLEGSLKDYEARMNLLLCGCYVSLKDLTSRLLAGRLILYQDHISGGHASGAE